MLTLLSIALIVAFVLALLCLVFRLLLCNRALHADLGRATKSKMHLASENLCLNKQISYYATRTKSLEDKISTMTQRPRDARGHFVPKERAAEVAQAREKLDELFASGQITRGVPVNLKS